MLKKYKSSLKDKYGILTNQELEEEIEKLKSEPIKLKVAKKKNKKWKI